MKTISIFVMSFLLVVSLPCIAAINYNISFTGSGLSTTVGDVVVHNLTKGTMVTIPAGNVLNLSDGLSTVESLYSNNETILVYPNSAGGTSTLSFFAKQAGNTQINGYNLIGRKVISINQNLQSGNNSFQLSLPEGSYVINVLGNEYTYSVKMINQSASQSKPEITFIGTEKPLSVAPQKSKSSNSATTTMTYNTGDRLLYNGTSGNYSTVVTDVPTAGKIINFDFAACTDADGNNYKVVKIGTQTWMAENLKTSKYNDGTIISLVTDNTGWTTLSTPAFCWYNNDDTNFKNKYGALYNWYAIITNKLAPNGWHIATDAEWSILSNYINANLGSSDCVAKALAASTDWTVSDWKGTLGDNLSINNSSAFSAIPTGIRSAGNGSFTGNGLNTYWWSSTATNFYNAYFRSLYYDFNNLNTGGVLKNCGFSVRCIKD